MSNFFAVGKEEHTGRYLFTVKDESVKQGGSGQIGVYLDKCAAIVTINTKERFWIFWLAEEAEGKTKGHTVSGKKTAEEFDIDVLEPFRKDLREANFPERFLFATNSLPEAKSILKDKLRVSDKAADGIILYLIKNQ